MNESYILDETESFDSAKNPSLDLFGSPEENVESKKEEDDEDVFKKEEDDEDVFKKEEDDEDVFKKEEDDEDIQDERAEKEEDISSDLYMEYEAMFTRYSEVFSKNIRPIFEYLMDREREKSSLMYICGILAGGGCGTRMSSFGVGFGVDFFFGAKFLCKHHGLVSLFLIFSSVGHLGEYDYGDVGFYALGAMGNQFLQTHRLTMYLVYLGTLSLVSTITGSFFVDALIVFTFLKDTMTPACEGTLKKKTDPNEEQDMKKEL